MIRGKKIKWKRVKENKDEKNIVMNNGITYFVPS